MKQTGIILLALLLVVSCKKADDKKAVPNNSRIELVPEPDKAERLRYEAIQKLIKSGCMIEEPNTSVNGIVLRESNSADSVMEEKDKIDQYDQYHFYSKSEREELTLTQHPGDGKYAISIFKVEKPGKESKDYRELNTDYFKTEKGIRLGISKKQLIEKLGKCYAAIDSTKESIELYYRIESPNDTKSKLLERNSMPIYYGSYKFWNDKLESFEFGFEYP